MNMTWNKKVMLVFALMVTLGLMSELWLSAKTVEASESDSKSTVEGISNRTPSGIQYTDIKREVDVYIKEKMGGCASVSVAVFQHDKTLYRAQFGYSNVEEKVPVNQDTVYEWGSVSKLMVWISVMQLYEQGKLDFNTDIREYLPKGFLTKLSYDKPITMLNLMNHNAGWQETTYDIEVSKASEIVDLETALKMTQPAQIYEPGTVTAYSNWGTALAALIVERISGEDYVTYIRDHIIEPLGMKHTSVAADLSDNQWVKKQRESLYCYSITKEYYEAYGTAIKYILLYPAGSITGTLDDFIVFAKSFVPREGVNNSLFKKPETLELMKSATSYYGDSGIARNCHGLWTLQYTADIMGHSGNTNGCTSTLMFEPGSGLGAVIMTNEMGETAYNYGILSLLFGDYSKNERVKDAVFTDSKDLSGIYTSSRSYEKGFSAIYKYMGSLLPLNRTEDSNQFRLAIGQGNLTKVGVNQYIMDNENGFRYLMYETTGLDGQTVLQMMSTDVIKENTIAFVMKLASVIAFVLGITFSIFSIIVKCIILVINRIRRKSRMAENRNNQIMHTIVKILYCLVGLAVYYLILVPLNGSSVSAFPVMVQCIILSLLAVISVVVAIRILKHIPSRKREKVKCVTMAIMSGYLGFFIWYWQLYNFWSC